MMIAMRKLLFLLLTSLWLPAAFAVDSQQMERDLQRLPWPQFRQVIESIPKMKADVEAYGPIGWSYVQQSYKTHGWKKNIDKLSEDHQKQLAELIRTAKAAR